jgi:hypothetical protein
MEEYELSPDQLIAKAFRILQSSRRGFKHNGKGEGIASIKSIYKKKGVAPRENHAAAMAWPQFQTGRPVALIASLQLPRVLVL